MSVIEEAKKFISTPLDVVKDCQLRAVCETADEIIKGLIKELERYKAVVDVGMEWCQVVDKYPGLVFTYKSERELYEALSQLQEKG